MGGLVRLWTWDLCTLASRARAGTERRQFSLFTDSRSQTLNFVLFWR